MDNTGILTTNIHAITLEFLIASLFHQPSKEVPSTMIHWVYIYNASLLLHSVQCKALQVQGRSGPALVIKRDLQTEPI